MIGTVPGLFLNMLAMVLMMESVRWMLVWLECQPGKLKRCPELSKLLRIRRGHVDDKKRGHGPVLTAGSSMKVDNYLEAMVAGPSDGLLEERKLTLYVGFAGADFECPIANGYADVIQARGR